MAEKKSPLSNFIPVNPAVSQDWLATMWMMPFQMSMACWESWMAMSDNYCRTVFRPASFHGHEHHKQLEVPDPIMEDGEHDLFA
ncbi:hypothetical protein MB02_06170 [Croceicoccus estronivorus]|uniref:hypothetical protein n=1 Tax=Croceicoccus estronivorus TaxID=1172626 RepID=UPI00083093CD|nr:hypothetical protein [Croceicoccus estronivorus]OCC25018.1 hypothetical protein MB02_06170 [Croceicoccus estronivorus]